MDSLPKRLAKLLMRLSGVKFLTDWTDGDILTWVIENDIVWDAEMPRWFQRRHESVERFHDGLRSFLFDSEEKEEGDKKYIFYIHGGGFIMEMYFLYWLFVHRLLENMYCQVVLPIYPLLPTADFDGAFHAVEATYKDWSTRLPADREIQIVADSSGCALALRLAQTLKKDLGRVPENLVLISPWVNMDVKEQVMKASEEEDPFICVDALKHCAQLAVPSGDFKNPHYSPLFGDLEGIGKISIFTGTGDTLYTDAVALRDRIRALKIPMNYYEHRGMFHIYPHFPIKEGVDAFNVILDIIRKKGQAVNQSEGFTVICE